MMRAIHYTSILMLALPMAGIAQQVDIGYRAASLEDGLPWPYAYLGDGFDVNTELIDLSSEPFLDYLVASSVGAPGLFAEKINGPYLSIAGSTAESLPGGANGFVDLDGGSEQLVQGLDFRPPSNSAEPFSLFLKWDDGEPLPEVQLWAGVSWGGTGDMATLETRVDLPSTATVYIQHWFNNGDFVPAGSAEVPPHELTVDYFTAGGTLLETQTIEMPLGGATGLFSEDYPNSMPDDRQFFSVEISVMPANAGDYLMIRNRGTNIGYRGTAVASEPLLFPAATTGPVLGGQAVGDGFETDAFGWYKPSNPTADATWVRFSNWNMAFVQSERDLSGELANVWIYAWSIVDGEDPDGAWMWTTPTWAPVFYHFTKGFIHLYPQTDNEVWYYDFQSEAFGSFSIR